jgi:hypothetical protein
MASAAQHVNMQAQTVRANPLSVAKLNGSAGHGLYCQIARDFLSGVAEISGAVAKCVNLDEERSSDAGPLYLSIIEVRAAVGRPDTSAMSDISSTLCGDLGSRLAEGTRQHEQERQKTQPAQHGEMIVLLDLLSAEFLCPELCSALLSHLGVRGALPDRSRVPGWQGEEDGEGEVDGQAQRDADPSESQADEVHEWSEGVLLRDVAGGGGERVIDEAMGDGVAPQHIKEDGKHEVGAVVEDSGGARVHGREVDGKHGSGEGHNCDSEQQQQVHEEQPMIGAVDMREHAVMVDPHDSDEEEAQQKCEVRRPLAQQLAREISLRNRRDLDLEDEQRDGDGEYAVRESFDARSFGRHECTGIIVMSRWTLVASHKLKKRRDTLPLTSDSIIRDEIWWRRRELNPRPKKLLAESLHA